MSLYVLGVLTGWMDGCLNQLVLDTQEGGNQSSSRRGSWFGWWNVFGGFLFSFFWFSWSQRWRRLGFSPEQSRSFSAGKFRVKGEELQLQLQAADQVWVIISAKTHAGLRPGTLPSPGPVGISWCELILQCAWSMARKHTLTHTHTGLHS